jgi:hypothetical protein
MLPKVAPCSFAVKESRELMPLKPLALNANKVIGTAKLPGLAAITVSSTRPSCVPPYRRSLYGREVRGMEVTHHGLDVERQFRKRLHPRAELTQGVLYYDIVETGNDHVIPMIAEAPQGHVQHGDNLLAQWLVRLKRDGA